MKHTEITLDFINQPVMYGRRWTPEEHKAFRRYAERGLPLEHIAQLMRRSYNGIVSRLQQIGFARFDPSTYQLYWTLRSGRTGRLERLPTEDTSVTITLSDAHRILDVCNTIKLTDTH